MSKINKEFNFLHWLAWSLCNYSIQVPDMTSRKTVQRKAHLYNDFKMTHFPISKERDESNNSERNAETSIRKSISSYRHNGDWPEQASQLNWSLVHEKQTEERNWSWFQLSFKDCKAVVQVQSCVVLMFEFLAKYIPHLSGPTTAFQCFLLSHVIRGDNQLWKYWCLWWLRGKLSLLLRFPRKTERLGDA